MSKIFEWSSSVEVQVKTIRCMVDDICEIANSVKYLQERVSSLEERVQNQVKEPEPKCQHKTTTPALVSLGTFRFAKQCVDCEKFYEVNSHSWIELNVEEV